MTDKPTKKAEILLRMDIADKHRLQHVADYHRQPLTIWMRTILVNAARSDKEALKDYTPYKPHGNLPGESNADYHYRMTGERLKPAQPTLNDESHIDPVLRDEQRAIAAQLEEQIRREDERAAEQQPEELSELEKEIRGMISGV